MRYLLFGASITFGETDFENGGWAGHLRKYLDTKENHCFFHNLAISGNTSKDILKRIEPEAKARLRNKPKEDWTMFICVGTNDSRLENNEKKVSEEEYKNNIIQILKIAKNLVGKVIVVGLSPVIEDKCNPFKEKIYFLNERIKIYDQIMKNCAKDEGVTYIEIFSKLENKDNLNELYDDGLHPNREGHLEIFNIIKDFL
jgi:acyl-CoA thioesterase I